MLIRRANFSVLRKLQTFRNKKGGLSLLFFINNRDYLIILATTPAPTVRPPSRIAKRKPSSIAIG